MSASILLALAEYYNRKADDPDFNIAPLGWEIKEIPYLIVLNEDGIPVDVQSTAEGTGKAKTIKRFRVPQGVKRSSGILANLLCDNPEYVVGVTIKKDGEKKHQAFRERFEEIGDVDDPGWRAVGKFLQLALEEKLVALSQFSAWEALLADAKSTTTFKLDGSPKIVAESPIVRRALDRLIESQDGADVGRCLVTNVEEPIEILHPAIKGVWGGNPTGTNIVNFNLAPFCSFGKKQGENAPVGKSIVFKYTTALNLMLDKTSRNRMQIGEASTVFWAERPSALEETVPLFFKEPTKDDPDANVEKMKAAYDSIRSGAFCQDEGDNRFYFLGLSPNAARIAIRFWIVSDVRTISKNIAQYFADLEIVRGPKEPPFLSLFRLLVSVASQGKSDNIPPTLEGDLTRAILENLPFSRTLFLAAIVRIRAERNVGRVRAAIIKAFLNRGKRFYSDHKEFNHEEIQMALDITNPNVGYRLGRLFATLEKIQAEANPGINATIRDRFYGSASGTPSAVFPNLMRLKNHHLSKLENAGRRVYFEKLLSEIISGLKEFPQYLTLEDQGRFAVGYYHQTQEFFTKKEQNNGDEKAK